MPELLAQGKAAGQQKRFAISTETVKLGKRPGESEWVVDWDPHIHGAHVSLRWQGDALMVAKLPNKRNPMYFHGKEAESALVPEGDFFVIGSTRFHVVAGAESTPSAERNLPVEELTCRYEELEGIAFTDPDIRIDVLAKLPEMIRKSTSEQELESCVVEALLRGIPGATNAALVQLDARSTEEQPVVTVKRATGQAGSSLPVSRRLVHKATRKIRQGFVHDWAEKRGDAGATVLPGYDWALCTPLLDDRVAGYALYATGMHPQLSGSERRESVQKSNLKFASLVAGIFVSLRRLQFLQAREAVLRSFLSPSVVAALGDKDAERTLARRETLVTVLFCDLRGSSRIAEEGSGDLAKVCDRVSDALAVMTHHILDKDGVISDFQGDAAMGFWGWPLDDDALENSQENAEDQVEKAARAALAIRREFVNANKRPGHRLADFACGIGIAHGRAIAGMLGTTDQFKVGVFGPVVNLASRLEGLTKATQASILLDQAAAEKLAENRRFATRAVAKVRPLGMKVPVHLHELLPNDPGSLDAAERDDYRAALGHFESGNWGDALDLLENRLAHDGPSAFLRAFIAKNKGMPPNDWDGIIRMSAKSFD